MQIGTYYVRWVYDIRDPKVTTPKYKSVLPEFEERTSGKKSNGIAKCQILTEDREVVAIGYALKAKGDPHIKRIARVISLKNALAALTGTFEKNSAKATRALFWDQYFKISAN